MSGRFEGTRLVLFQSEALPTIRYEYGKLADMKPVEIIEVLPIQADLIRFAVDSSKRPVYRYTLPVIVKDLESL